MGVILVPLFGILCAICTSTSTSAVNPRTISTEMRCGLAVDASAKNYRTTFAYLPPSYSIWPDAIFAGTSRPTDLTLGDQDWFHVSWETSVDEVVSGGDSSTQCFYFDPPVDVARLVGHALA
ncbi:hypothetical protein AYO20_11499 [Fonsecaea nubica]|uniref:Uncharacterized protein n=1 Tax=Fonsecaea nubica TaxID=856822 RepID=A0A178BRT4_9EURO|nr:hypothetical protein AYO20_11499 [Fonsecaea nubica]OAL20348.1 hypothetical protein AYO20_11499 [Fonsecaea nubica]